jgi:glycosyltransferase involved in cell wall biosynthesis
MGLVVVAATAVAVFLVALVMYQQQQPKKISEEGYIRMGALIMVKNEALVIKRLLESLKGTVQEIFLCDTGSTDGTINVGRVVWGNDTTFHVQKAAPFINFEHNRNMCKRMFQKKLMTRKIDYILLPDADFTLLRPLSKTMTKPQYQVNILQLGSHNALPLLVETDVFVRQCKYRLWTHEILVCKNASMGYFNGVSFNDHYDGSSRANKLQRDHDLLKKWLQEKGPLEDDMKPRALYYLGQTQYDGGNYSDARDTWTLFLNEPNAEWNYRYWVKLKLALLNVSESGLLDVHDEYDGYYRREHFYYLARHARETQKNPNRCIMWATAGLYGPPTDYSRMPLFIDKNIHEWALREELAFCLSLRNPKAAAREYGIILNTPSVPENVRERAENEIKRLSL